MTIHIHINDSNYTEFTARIHIDYTAMTIHIHINDSIYSNSYSNYTEFTAIVQVYMNIIVPATYHILFLTWY